MMDTPKYCKSDKDKIRAYQCEICERYKSFDAESAGLTRVFSWDDIGRILLT